jgi:hypothetical protein
VHIAPVPGHGCNMQASTGGEIIKLAGGVPRR